MSLSLVAVSKLGLVPTDILLLYSYKADKSQCSNDGDAHALDEYLQFTTDNRSPLILVL